MALDAADAWYTVLFFQGVATTIVCLVLRMVGFRIERAELLLSEGHSKKWVQFSIRHIFYWTTGVAVTLAAARLVGWPTLLSWAKGADVGPALLFVTPLLTVVSVLGMWGALGSELWIARLSVLLVMLPGIGGLAGGATIYWTRSGYARRLFAGSYMQGSIQTGIIWSVLAGVLLSGLLLVFRTSGHRLQRRVGR